MVAGWQAVELVSHGVLPGRQELLERGGRLCRGPARAGSTSPPGPSFSGRFFSRARRQLVGYTIAYPPGYGPGNLLPLVVALHGYGANHTDTLSALSPAKALALRQGGRGLLPMAMVTVDGGGGYWHPTPATTRSGWWWTSSSPCVDAGASAGPRRESPPWESRWVGTVRSW